MSENSGVGQILKEKRADKSLTLDDVCSKTKISKNIIRSLEEENVNILLERTYYLGHLLSYAKFLEVENPQDLVQQLDDYYNLKQPEYSKENKIVFLDEQYSLLNTIKTFFSDWFNNTKTNKKSFFHRNKNFLLTILFVLILFLSYILITSIISKSQITSNSNSIIEEDIRSQNNTENSFIVVDKDNTIQQEGQVEIEENNNAIPQEGQVEIEENNNTIQQEGQVEIEENNNAIPQEEQVEIEENNIVVDSITKITTPEISYESWPVETRDYTISLAFSDDVWVQIYNQHNPNIIYLEQTFVAGDIYDVPKVDDLAMKVGNYKSILLIVDLQEIELVNTKNSSLVLDNIILEKEYLINNY